MLSGKNNSVPANETGNQLNSGLLCFFTDSVAVQVCKVIAYCAVLLSGLVGNTFLVIIICRRRELRKTVNYFIINVAVSDFMFSLAGMPIKLAQLTSSSLHWHVSGDAGSILCKMYMFSTVVSLMVSLQSIVWIAIDRFVAVMFPMKVRIISSKFRAIVIASTWILALAVRTPYMMITNLAKYNNVTYCGVRDIVSVFENITTFKTFSLATEAIFFIAPLILVTVLYFLIAVVLKRRMKYLARISSHIQPQVFEKNARAVKMALCMILAYGMCFVPYLIYFYALHGVRSCSFHKVFVFFVLFMLYSSSTVNPIICFAFVRGFRLELKERLNQCFKKCSSHNSDMSSQP